MKIELSKEDMAVLDMAMTHLLGSKPGLASVTDIRHLAYRIKDISGWTPETYDRNEREQSRVEHAGSKVLYPIPAPARAG